ncbi:Anaphase-promoting complex subunit 4 [Nakaseomyces bracarensis]|uniref:Anaphase-promoting complex subunit 4 n=1 Tax=Nakaseomyces bracarensis TaxID=273131 RepID=A0ABR4NWG9_9SACH
MDHEVVRDGFLKYNPRYGLYAMNQDGRSIVVYRISDSTPIVKINVRDINIVLDYCWDPIDGKYISMFLRDGSVRIYNVFNDGKLVSLLRLLPMKLGPKPNVNISLWDRITFPVNDDSSLRIPNNDITKNMPRIVKFVVEAKQIEMVPYKNMTKVWRTIEDPDKKVVDLHFGYIQEATELQVLVDGEYLINTVKLRDVNSRLKPVALMKSVEKRGVYMLWLEDNSCITIDLRDLILNQDKLDAIECLIKMRSLNGFLQDHLMLIEKYLVVPYFEFLETIKGKDYRAALEDMFLIGQTDEDLQSWFVDIINEKNLKKWARIGNEMYSNFKQILILVLIPVCEQILALCTRINGMIRSIRLQNENDKDSQVLDQTPIQHMLTNALLLIENINEEEICFKDYFLPWLTDKVYGSINEDYKSTFFKNKNGNNKVILSIIDYFQTTVVETNNKLQVKLNQLISLASTFKDQLQKFDDQYGRLEISQGISTTLKGPTKPSRLLALRKLNQNVNILLEITEFNGVLQIALCDEINHTLICSEQYLSLINEYNYQIVPKAVTTCILVDTEKLHEEDTYMHRILGDENNHPVTDQMNVHVIFDTEMDIEIENNILITLSPPSIKLVAAR